MNQQPVLFDSYDYIVCGAGTSGSVVARRLAEAGKGTVLLIEAGGCNDVEEVREPSLWGANLGSDRDWNYFAEPNPALNGRSMPLSMGKGLGGGSAINVMIWARGHRNDWEYFAEQSKDKRWSYDNVLKIYRTIEDWTGKPDPLRRGTGGLVEVNDVPDPNPVSRAMLASCEANGIPVFPDQNGILMEGPGGAASPNVRFRAGQRLTIYDSYVRPIFGGSNLTVITRATVSKIQFSGSRASSVEMMLNGEVATVSAGREIILSLGAINTPKLLMQSGIGDAASLRRHGIDVVADLPAVGANFQDHVMVAGCLWEYPTPIPPANNAAEATFFWKSDPSLDTPDLQPFQIEIPYITPETARRYDVPEASWSISPALVRPKSRGRIELSGPALDDPVRIHANTFGETEDLAALVKCMELCRDIGNSADMAPFRSTEVMPGPLSRTQQEDFIRDGAVTYWHQSCTARMGVDQDSVVDGRLKVHGLEGLRIADASVMPRVTTGNTMAPCVIIGEIAASSIIEDQVSAI